MILFENGLKGLSDTKWSGVKGSANKIVGIDYRSEPGVTKAQQKLTKISPAVGEAEEVDELCKIALPLSDGSTLWFSSESGKMWREVADVFTEIDPVEILAYDLRTMADAANQYVEPLQVNIPTKIQWKDDGTIMYVMCNSASAGDGDGDSGWIFEYDLSTAWDVSTASYNGNFFDADDNAQGFYMKQDGTKFYISEDTGSKSVIEYDLSTAWDITTASLSGDTYDYTAEGTRSCGVTFKPDGTVMYLSFNDGTENIKSYDLSTAWDITTAVHNDTLNVDVSYGRGGCDISPDGTTLIAYLSTSGTDGATLAEYRMSTPWDLSTATDTTRRFYTGESSYGADLDFGCSFIQDFSKLICGDQDEVELSEFTLGIEDDTNVTILGAEEFAVPDGEDGDDEDLLDDEMTQYVYFATKNWLFRIALADITSDWDEGYEYLTEFKWGDDTYHPMKKANGRLYIGDKHTLCEVNENGVITLETDFSVREPERITILKNFDVDLLIGTKLLNQKSRVLRWDTSSTTWYGEDDIYEGEIHAFLDDDNYTYAIAGDYGHMFYYDGEKLLKHTRIPGDYGPTARCKVNANSVAYFLGVPVFGLSNIEGNPNLQGIHSYGQYSKDYPITMDLSFPISTDEFSGVEIGAIIIQGTDIYSAYKSGTDVGIDKIDWTAKYDGGYIETMVLNRAKDRSDFKSLKEVLADYIEMPASTSLAMAYDKNYAGYTTLEQQNDDKLLQLRAPSTVPEIGAITVKFTFGVNGNNTPKIENFHANFHGEE